MAQKIAENYDHDQEALSIGSYLHDIVSYRKGSVRVARRAKTESMRIAKRLFEEVQCSPSTVDIVYDVIECHGFSQKKIPLYVEGRIIQDADKIDALGYVGIARLFQVSGQLGSAIISINDPLCQKRSPDDKRYALDHIFRKLAKLPQQMNTEYGRKMAEQKLSVVFEFAEKLANEAYNGVELQVGAPRVGNELR